MKSHITFSNYLFLNFTSKYNKNMTKLRKLFRFIARIDNFNRIIVFVSMTLFIVLPSMYLYKTTNDNYSFDVVMPSTFLLGLIIGNGLLVLYKPLRSTWLYFLICIIAFPFIYFAYDFQSVSIPIHHLAIFWICYIYCILGFLINLIYLLTLFRKKSKSEMDEKTNNDNSYDFLGGEKKNKVVAEHLKELRGDDFIDRASDRIKRAKLSRLSRVVSFVFMYVTIFVYFCLSTQIAPVNENLLSTILLIGLLTLPIVIVASLLYPLDFKYLFYFNAFLILVLSIISCSVYHLHPAMLIVAIIIVGLSFLVTLIVEGRTWTGANPD